jgi:hypothetical protein
MGKSFLLAVEERIRTCDLRVMSLNLILLAYLKPQNFAFQVVLRTAMHSDLATCGRCRGFYPIFTVVQTRGDLELLGGFEPSPADFVGPAANRTPGAGTVTPAASHRHSDRRLLPRSVAI